MIMTFSQSTKKHILRFLTFFFFTVFLHNTLQLLSVQIEYIFVNDFFPAGRVAIRVRLLFYFYLDFVFFVRGLGIYMNLKQY